MRFDHQMFIWHGVCHITVHHGFPIWRFPSWTHNGFIFAVTAKYKLLTSIVISTMVDQHKLCFKDQLCELVEHQLISTVYYFSRTMLTIVFRSFFQLKHIPVISIVPVRRNMYWNPMLPYSITAESVIQIDIVLNN